MDLFILGYFLQNFKRGLSEHGLVSETLQVRCDRAKSGASDGLSGMWRAAQRFRVLLGDNVSARQRAD